MELLTIGNVVITIINGKPYVTTSLTKEEVDRLVADRDTISDEDALAIVAPSFAEKVRKGEEVKKTIETLYLASGFEEKGGAFYRDGIAVSMPLALAKRYTEAVEANNEKMLSALDHFWTKCALNTDPVVRRSLFPFLEKYGFTITDKGYFLVYRNVKIYEGGTDKEVHDFVSTLYWKMKKNKKGIRNYWVTDDLTYNKQGIGTNLEDKFNSLKNYSETVYTDAYSGTTRIRLGRPVFIPREQCDSNPDNLCSKGLHVAGADWLPVTEYGDTPIVCLVNPMHVVAVPSAEGSNHYGKMRVCEYLPYALIERENGKIIIPESNLFEESYDRFTVEQLNEMLKNASLEDEIFTLDPGTLLQNNTLNELALRRSEAYIEAKNRFTWL
jgi:hypothetical protein